ncbi:uncharacterized protein LOC114338236 [Diabrotica virgifera virgifera]|uniref:Uncharacterized protein LOC114338236 n=1 Tax=Diabrotica virgifera virgifera TaxID=50390 RepID=A0A6P7GDX0_DIAVI|nr:uncharacterized protein LOC114338236 [Diabrotica virgifera virgifera]
MDDITEKQVKDQLNQAKQLSLEEQNLIDTETNDEEDKQSLQSLEKIQEIFAKTETMKELAKEKNKELEEQFKDLKHKLNSSSEYLQRIKNNIENIKFSYQKNIIDLHKHLDPATAAENSQFESQDAMKSYIEDIRKKIEDLQTRSTAQEEEKRNQADSYEKAFDRIVSSLQDIEKGAYSSKNLLGE